MFSVLLLGSFASENPFRGFSKLAHNTFGVLSQKGFRLGCFTSFRYSFWPFAVSLLVLRLGQIIASLSCVVGGFNSSIMVLGTLLDAGCWARGD